MPSITDRIKHLLNSPKGRQAQARAQQLARDPRNRRKIQQLLARLKGRKH